MARLSEVLPKVQGSEDRASNDPPQFSSPSAMAQHPPIVLFDDAHGQGHWQQTGFTSREMPANFSGVAKLCQTLGATCSSGTGQPLMDGLSRATLLGIPPPAGEYDSRHERWQRDATTLFRAEQIQAVLRFLRNGGRLLAFTYRFGDSFTQTNLRDLLGPLGCFLNDDAVIDLNRLRTVHPLQSQFATPKDCLSLAWAAEAVETVLWRSMATFTLIPLPGTMVRPLVFSPGGRCISFNRTHRQISFLSLPIAVAGTHGDGRFVLFGGPHAFETGTFGLLAEADNARFLENVLRWLLADELTALEPIKPIFNQDNPLLWKQFCQIEGQGRGEPTVAYLERLLRTTGVLKALSRASWET
jgi:hypothetical protein